jgi:uncharacterized protein (DUF362 family)
MVAKGVAVRMSSYEGSVGKVLNLIKFNEEIKKHNQIVIKVHLVPGNLPLSTKPEFVEQIVKFCLANKEQSTQIMIAEGVNGFDTRQIFDEMGYTKLAEKYGVGLIDLNESQTVQIQSPTFLRFDWIHYPEVLLNSFIILASTLSTHEELTMSASLNTMQGAFPAKHYKGLFAKHKNKLDKFPLKYQVHDILKCKMPELALIDCIDKGLLVVGKPIDMDKQSAKLLGFDWQNVQHLRLIDESFKTTDKQDGVDELLGVTPEQTKKA